MLTQKEIAHDNTKKFFSQFEKIMNGLLEKCSEEELTRFNIQFNELSPTLLGEFQKYMSQQVHNIKE